MEYYDVNNENESVFASHLEQVTFDHNTAAGFGGGIHMTTKLTQTLPHDVIPTGDMTNVLLENNNAQYGGGLATGWQVMMDIDQIWISTCADNPGYILGYGTWEPFADGRSLVGVLTSDSDFNAVLKTGGAKTVTLTVAQMAAHRHMTQGFYNMDDSGGGGQVRMRYQMTSDPNEVSAMGGGWAGNDQPHNNMPPYVTVYMFRRIA